MSAGRDFRMARYWLIIGVAAGADMRGAWKRCARESRSDEGMARSRKKIGGPTDHPPGKTQKPGSISGGPPCLATRASNTNYGTKQVIFQKNRNFFTRI
jgi:hypothetical protein